MSRTELRASTPSVVIEPMGKAHLRRVLRIESQSGRRGWSRALFVSELDRGADRNYLVATVDAEVVGFAGMLFVEPEGHVTTIAVDESSRGRRVATHLMLALARDAAARGTEAMTLEVRVGNEPALALYRRFGFAPAGVRARYYSDTGDDALIMWANDVDSASYVQRLDAIERSLVVVDDATTEVVA